MKPTNEAIAIAIGWLYEYLADDAWHSQGEIHEAARVAGLSRDALWYARRKLKVQTRRVFDWRWHAGELSVEDVLQAPPAKSPGAPPRARLHAENVILSILTQESPQPSTEVMRKAGERGVTPHTFHRARKALGLYAQQINGRWMMSADWVRHE